MLVYYYNIQYPSTSKYHELDFFFAELGQCLFKIALFFYS